MKLSVVMPVYNNAGTIKRSINSFYQQSLPRTITVQGRPETQYELVVVDDGSTDQTPDLLKRLEKSFGLRWIRQANQGPAAARNLGAKEARGSVILFTQGDIIATQTLLQCHLDFHLNNLGKKSAMIGQITWHPDLRITPFMYWLEHGGPQFDFDRLKSRKQTDYLAFYTPNLSLKKKFFAEHDGFDEDFRTQNGVTAYEDTELGFRLYQDGMDLVYKPDAVAYHYHPKSLEDVCRRRVHEGRMAKKLYQKHPDFRFATADSDSLCHNLTHLKTGFISDRWRYLLTRLLVNKFTVWPFERLARWAETRMYLPLVYKIVTGYYYNQGVSEWAD